MMIKKELERILKNKEITTLFQPVVSLKTGEIIGYEALSRGPENSELYSPIELLLAAEKYNRLWELEMLFREKAIRNASKLFDNDEFFLFLNVDPEVINDPHFERGLTKELLKTTNLSSKSIVFEITERTAIKDYKNFKKVLGNYKNQGYFIAIDDAGSGYSGMKTIKETVPHFIKVDMDLIRDIHKDKFKQSIIKALVNLSNEMDIKLIAEGIEIKEELEVLMDLGVYGGQGYLIQKPSKSIDVINKDIVNYISTYNQLDANLFNYKNNYHNIGSITERVKAFSYDTSCEKIKEYLDNSKKDGICLIDDKEEPMGLIMKNKLDAKLAMQYGFALYYKKSVDLIMDRCPLVVDIKTSVYEVSKRAMNRSDESNYDNIIITKNNKYYGQVSVKKLLQFTTSVEKDYAKELNPLTKLPGNSIINRVLNDIIIYKNECCVLYLDLDNFKIYNDIYGFENGDKVIQYTSNIINSITKEYFPYNSFVGHIGGDDFVAVIETDIHNSEKLCKNIISNFNEGIKEYYNDNISISKTTSLSIAGLYGNISNYSNVKKFAQHMSNIKKKAKKTENSSFIIEYSDYKHKKLS